MKKKRRKILKLMGDLETTVFEGQTCTDVWASGLVEIKDGIDIKDCIIHNNLDDTMHYIFKLKRKCMVFYHNLKFDGVFIVSWLYNNGFTYATYTEDGIIRRKKVKELLPYEFNTFISDMGQWYSITVKTPQGNIVTFLDSLKLLPFSVKQIGESFNTKYKKSTIKYEGLRFAYGEITDNEKDYLSKDLLIPAEALNTFFNQGFEKSTIGSNALSEYKSIIGFRNFDEVFPNMDNLESPLPDRTLDNYIRNAYHGGWCYVVKGKENKIFNEGLTLDVNSLYPSVMQDENNIYPVGIPRIFHKEIPDHVLNRKDIYYFVRIKTRFYIKEGYLPFIQIKGSPFYNSTENLTTSDVYMKGKYHKRIYDINGNISECIPILTMTRTDFELFKEHYNLVDFEVLDGVYYHTVPGNVLFGDYIHKWSEIKKNSKGAVRQTSKLFLNSLYGKFATNKRSNWKLPYLDEEGKIAYTNIVENNKKLVQVSVGAAITSYARNFTIRAAQKNYYGVNKRGFIYADTDSIHCDLTPEEIRGVNIHPTEFSNWKIECLWSEAVFIRQKTYIEKVVKEDDEIVTPYYNIKCAGMNKKCKDLLRLALSDRSISVDDVVNEYESLDQEQLDFIKDKKTLLDFKQGLEIKGKLLPKTIKGGVILEETYFTLR